MSSSKDEHEWIAEYPSAITVCDADGIIVAMNEASRINFEARGGAALIGTSLFACHSESAGRKIRQMLRQKTSQTYIVENKTRKRLVHQSPWYKNKEFAGLVETIIDLSGEVEVRRRN